MSDPFFPDPIVVTGVGLLCPLGKDREDSWRALIDGNAAAPPGGGNVPLSSDGRPRALQLAQAAAREALADAGLPPSGVGERWGCAVSATKPLIVDAVPPDDPSSYFPFYLGGGSSSFFLAPDIVPHAVAREFGVEGPVMNFSSACATGLHSVMAAAGWIQDGRCDFVLAGAAESSLNPLYMAGFSQMGVLSTTGKVRPFDRARDGFLVGEGAAVFVLERAASARARGARVFGRLAGWDFAMDGHHPVRFNSNGRRIAASLGRAIERASFSPVGIDYVNAHGTATPLNDRLESLALEAVFADHPGVAVSSTKGATGHLLGAAGAVELAFTLLALRDGRLPPTLNLEEPESRILNFVPGKTVARAIRKAAALSFGFGGAIASLVVEKDEGHGLP